MTTAVETRKRIRFRTGEAAPYAAWFKFDIYGDGTGAPLPVDEERVVFVDAGSAFPAVSCTDKDCWWKFYCDE